MPEIRRLTPADAPAYRALRLRALWEYPQAFTSSYAEDEKLPPEATVNRLASAHLKFWGAFDMGELCGMIGMDRETRAKCRHKATVVGMYVAPEVGGQGVARAVEHHVTSTLAKLKDAHDPSDEIVATSLQIGPRHRYDQKLQEQVFVGTQVSRSLTARFSRQADLERFLATVETSQSLRISDVTTELSSEAELRRALRDKAIASAKTKADDMARAYGARLGPVYSVSDVAPQFEYGIREGEWPVRYEWRSGGLDRIEVTGSRLERAGVDTSLQSGYVTYTDKIYTVFLLAD